MTDQSPSQAAALTPEVRTKAVEKIGVRASELTFDWLCGEFEDLPNKLAEDMSVKITDSIILALGEGSVIDDFADAAQQVTELKAALEEAEARFSLVEAAMTRHYDEVQRKTRINGALQRDLENAWAALGAAETLADVAKDIGEYAKVLADRAQAEQALSALQQENERLREFYWADKAVRDVGRLNSTPEADARLDRARADMAALQAPQSQGGFR